MKQKKPKLIFNSKPTFWYYFLALFFPIMFFLVDNSSDIFKDWTRENNEWIIKIFAIFMFFGIPILLLIRRKEIKFYEDRIEIFRPAIKKNNIYYFKDLVYWNIIAFYAPKAGNQTTLRLKFKQKKLDFNKIELMTFNKLQELLEKKFPEKKRQIKQKNPTHTIKFKGR